MHVLYKQTFILVVVPADILSVLQVHHIHPSPSKHPLSSPQSISGNNQKNMVHHQYNISTTLQLLSTK